MTSGIIFDIKRYAVNDGPGIRTTAFLKGCPLNCTWCHNPESRSFTPELMPQASLCIGCGACVAVCPEKVATGRPDLFIDKACTRLGVCAKVCPTGARTLCGYTVSSAELVKILLKDRLFYDRSAGGVTLSGGEPLAQGEFALEVLEKLGSEEIHRAVDTCGYLSPDLLEQASKVCDLFLFDLKLINSDAHIAHTGVDNKVILDNLQLLAKLRAKVLVRIPLIPGINDSSEELRGMASFINSLPIPYPVKILPYHSLPEGKYAALGLEYTLQGLKPPTVEEVSRAEAMFTPAD